MKPVKVYFPRENNVPKVLVAKTQEELDALQKIGWKVQD